MILVCKGTQWKCVCVCVCVCMCVGGGEESGSRSVSQQVFIFGDMIDLVPPQTFISAPRRNVAVSPTTAQ
jgi:hypothetical protein